MEKGQAMAQKTTARLPTIGAVIRAWRLFRGMSSTELAEKAGVRLGYVSELEHDKKTRPEEEYLEKLANALEVPLEDILGRRMPLKKRGDGQTVEANQQAISPPLPTMSPAVQVGNTPLGTTGQYIDRLIASGDLSPEEEDEVAAALIEMTKRFLAFRKAMLQMEQEK